jgi:hypothetical protein
MSCNVVSITPHHEQDLMVIGTDCTGRCKSNFPTITTMMATEIKRKQAINLEDITYIICTEL